jgi:hypothetical protein
VAEKIRHTIDFKDRLEANDSIVDASWRGSPGGELTFEKVSSAEAQTNAIIGEGQGGTFYRVVAQVETDDGLVLERGAVLPVGNVYQEPEDLTLQRVAYMARQFLRDRPESNELDFGDLEHSEDDLRRAVNDALADWNATSPHTSHELETFPTRARRLLYMRVAIEALRSAAQSESRNQYQYSDQGFSVQEHSRGQMYVQLARQLNQEYERKKKKYKTSANAQSYWGGTTIDGARGSGPYGDDPIL